MSFYLDTSVIISMLLNDAHSNRAEAWLAGQGETGHFVSDWTGPEVSSALAIRVRRNVLTPAGCDQALSIWHMLCRDSFPVLAVDSADFQRAAVLIDRHALGLRAPDALHLAIAERVGAKMVTFDERLAHACQEIGVGTTAI